MQITSLNGSGGGNSDGTGHISPQKIMMQLFLNLVHQLFTVLMGMVGLQMYQVHETDNVFWKVEHPSGASGLNYNTRYAISSASGTPSTASVGTANAGALWSGTSDTTFGHNSATGRRGIDLYHTSDYTSSSLLTFTFTATQSVVRIYNIYMGMHCRTSSRIRRR